MDRVLVLGIGNSLLSDEGAGIHTLVALQSRQPELPGVRFLDGGTLSFTLLSEIAEADALVVIDSAKFDGKPGDLLCLEGEAMDTFLAAGKLSVHEVGLADLFDIAWITGDLPKRRALVGIQPHKLDWGMTPSPAVAEAIPHAVDCILYLLRHWRREASSEETRTEPEPADSSQSDPLQVDQPRANQPQAAEMPAKVVALRETRP